MDPFTLPPLAAILHLAYTGLMALTAFIAPWAGAPAAAVVVVLVTFLVRAALIPAGVAQAKAEQVRARIAPKLRDLQKRYRTDPERLQRETMRLYRDEKSSPFAGCLPVIAQAPVVGVIYAVFLHPTIAGRPNALLAETLFGVPLGSSLVGTMAGGAMDAPTAAVFGVLVLLIAAVDEVTRRLLRVPTPPRGAALMLATPVHLLGVLQFATAVVAIFVPLAAGLYLVVTVTWTLGQRLVLRRIFPPPSVDRSSG